MTNPYASPQAESPLPPQEELTLASVLLQALQSVGRNAAPLIAAGVSAGVLYLVSICTLAGWIAVLPLLLYGGATMLLETIRGRTRLRSLAAGLQQPVRTFATMWGFMLITLLLSTPVFGVSIGLYWDVIMSAAAGEAIDPTAQLGATAAATVVSAVYGFFTVRFMLAPFYIVDRQVPVLEAVVNSWKHTQGAWSTLVGLQMLFFLFQAPGSAFYMGMTFHQQGLTPEEVVAFLPIQLGGNLVLGLVGGIIATVRFASYAVVYTRLRASRPAAA